MAGRAQPLRVALDAAMVYLRTFAAIPADSAVAVG